jgi:Integrase core domain/Integrase zinc binding domain
VQIAHIGHNGIQHAIRRARQSMFWCNMTNDIKNHVQECGICQGAQKSNVKEPIIVKPVPTEAFEIVASDLFHFAGREHLLLVDSFSGFFHFEKLMETTSEATIEILKEWFSLHGIPKELHSDNGPQYCSAKFRSFTKVWKFKHITSSPGHPRSNGLAELYVQTAKNLFASEIASWYPEIYILVNRLPN